MASGFAPFGAPRNDGAALCGNAASRLDDDARGGAVRAARLAELAPDVLGDLAENRGLRAVGFAHDQRAPGVRGFANLEVERHLAQERHAEPFRLAPRAAVAENFRARPAFRAD